MVKINLQHILRDRKMTQAELAKLTGIRPSTVCDLCNNNADFLKLENLDRICSALRCDVSEIVSVVSSAKNGGNDYESFKSF